MKKFAIILLIEMLTASLFVLRTYRTRSQVTAAAAEAKSMRKSDSQSSAAVGVRPRGCGARFL